MSLFSGLIREVASVVNTLSVSAKEKKRIQADLLSAVNRQLEALNRNQTAVVKGETDGNWLQRSWRPLVMLSFAGIVVVGVLFDLPLLAENSRLWDLLEIGLGGYVVGRSLESMQGLFTKSKRHGKR